MKTLAFALALSAAPCAAAERPQILDLREVSVLPAEPARFSVQAGCADPSRACELLRGLTPSMAIRPLDAPTGLDAADRESLRTSPSPVTAVLGAPITQAEALGRIGGEICGRDVFERSLVDQYGAPWGLAPYMFLVDGEWEHRWTVVPAFAGYQVEGSAGRRRVTVLETAADVARARGGWDGFLQSLRDARAAWGRDAR